MNAISEARLQEVHPKLAERVRSMAEMLADQNIEIQVTQGFRSWKEQEELYAQGRTVTGSIVTNAQPGHSWHQFGLAVDVAPFDNGIPDWNPNHPVWQRIVSVGKSVGLTAGAEWRTFPDWPHFQMTGRLPVSPDDSVRGAFTSGGLDAVWNETGLDA